MKKRAYHSDARSAKAADTRQRILASGKRLFSKSGIDKVTIEEIAEDAKVSVPTVYALFQSKSGILKALTEKILFNDSLLKLVENTNSLTDPEEILKVTASIACTIYGSERTELSLLRGASSFSNDLKRIEKEFETIRFNMQEKRCKQIWKKGAVKAGLDLASIRDIMWMYTSRDIYRHLVVDRGWDPAKFEKWLAATLMQALLRE